MTMRIASANNTNTNMRTFYRYLCHLNQAKQILWCYLIWYLTMVSLHFDPAIHIWLTSLGISAVIGFALLLSVSNVSGARRDLWTTARLFMMPFCVSSFSALVKDQGFILILSPRWFEDALALALCAAFLAVTGTIQHFAGRDGRATNASNVSIARSDLPQHRSRARF